MSLFDILYDSFIDTNEGILRLIRPLNTSAFTVVSVSDGSALDTSLASAIADFPIGGGTIFLPAGRFTLSTTQTATKHVRIVGAGAGNNLSGDDTPVTTITWTGGAAAMFYSNGHQYSWSFDGIMLDGDLAATYGVHAVEMQDQRWGTLHVQGCTTAQVFLYGDDTASCAFNVFDHLKLGAAGTANMLRLDGSGSNNCCHNRFGSIIGSKSGTGTGVYFGDTDNNVVLMTFIFQADAGSTTGWEFAANARANYVWHMQAANLTARTGTRNSIGWWDRENGQGEPTVEGTAILNYESDLYGKHFRAAHIHNGDGTTTLFNAPGTWHNEIKGSSTTFYHNVTVSGASSNGKVSFPSNTGVKLDLYGGDYAIGVEGGETRIASGGNVTFRTSTGYSGTESMVVTPTGISLIDGVTAPSTVAGKAQLYVDTADGDLKIKFGDGTVKTIVVDT